MSYKAPKSQVERDRLSVLAALVKKENESNHDLQRERFYDRMRSRQYHKGEYLPLWQVILECGGQWWDILYRPDVEEWLDTHALQPKHYYGEE